MSSRNDAPPDQTSVDLPCHGCGYDLRAHPHDGQCPECGASVAAARRAAAVPRRPAWRDSDPRWRRRILAGAWLLVLLPLMDVLTASGFAASVPVPTVFDARGALHTLDDTLLTFPGLYPSVVFCVGVVLLFSSERGRRRGRLDWTRRWGVVCCYVVLLLSATQLLFIAALIAIGIGAVFQSMPLENQPAMTLSLVRWSTAYFRYGPQPGNAAGVVMVASSSIVMLLACVPLFDALRSSGPRRPALFLVAAVALFALLYLASVAEYWLGNSNVASTGLGQPSFYFRPDLLVTEVGYLLSGRTLGVPEWVALFAEIIKWCAVLAIAGWTTAAQVAAGRHRRKPTPP